MSSPWAISQGGYIALVTILTILVVGFVVSAAVSYRRKARTSITSNDDHLVEKTVDKGKIDTAHRISQYASYYSINS